MKGSKKQISYAKSLIQEILVDRINRFEAKRPERIVNEKAILAAIGENTEASKLIDVLTSNHEASISMIGKHPKMNLEATLNYLKE